VLFVYLKSIVCTKVSNQPLDEYVPFLITRWLSFGLPESTTALNETVNSLGNIPKNIHYKLLISLFPKLPHFIKFNYIKRKQTNTEKEDEQRIKLIANNLELSTREIKQLQKNVEFFNTMSK